MGFILQAVVLKVISWAFKPCYLRREKTGNHIISGIAEHGSIRSTLEALSQQNYEVTLLPLNQHGQMDVEKLKEATREDTVLVVIQHANSEIGSIQPVQEIGEWCKENEILFHCDTVHSFAKMDLKPITPMIDSLSISSHKFYGPKGTGVAYVNPKLAWKPYYPGTSHENGFRPGTLNVPAIAAMTVAAQNCHKELSESLEKANQLREGFLSTLEKERDRYNGLRWEWRSADSIYNWIEIAWPRRSVGHA